VNSGLLSGLTATAPRTGRAVLTRRQTLSSARKTQARTNIGAGTSSFDPTTYAGALNAGAITASGALTAAHTVIGSKQAVSGNGAVTAPNLTTLTTIYTGTTGSNLTATLPSGTVDGQIKIISLFSNDGTQIMSLTAAMADSYNTATWSAGNGNASLILQWDSAASKWVVVAIDTLISLS
jgi:hypothetical protein